MTDLNCLKGKPPVGCVMHSCYAEIYTGIQGTPVNTLSYWD